MKKKAKKIEEIKKLIDNFSGVKSIAYGNNKVRKTVEIEVSSNEDIISYILALLEVCYYTLDGNGLFISPAHENFSPTSSVTKVIELIMDLLPDNQMHCMDTKAKKECLKHYDRKCVLCGFEDKTSKYTNIDIIEVHHLKPISEINEEYIVNPIKDLRPVCPNCHRALHSKVPAYSIEELKIVLNNNC
ncbi:hypothetical protein NBRC110019_32180 [Neptunitalea chrysea]|uniref:HNH domain-containing protein n=1 Tax=Neptunitalea chrysea TaxID=1647581 RepID=A0A9W6B967_9FLAO|nr:HNH endonuclease [Neptunitalea chrysea]GLB54177.1 hypothetical protein NBRC110019_32180 [Neptunitalea chrysea]